MQRFGCSQRNALRTVGMSFSTYRYESRRRDETALTMRIKEITDTRVHYGYRRVILSPTRCSTAASCACSRSSTATRESAWLSTSGRA
jgi:hypothetical protein